MTILDALSVLGGPPSAAGSKHHVSLVDRASAIFTANGLVGLALLTSFKMFAGRPIECADTGLTIESIHIMQVPNLLPV